MVAGHAALTAITTMWVSLSVMGLDPCAYVACGQEHWAHVGVITAMIGGVTLFFADLGAVVARISAHKPAWFIPPSMCVAQGLLATACLIVVSWAGPL
ncbi:hypothetical protein DVS77_26680 [Mycolicibacterium moriokaense]|nr:hypothetical protein DVS77_26680 [Mycolicibacterium moriokaense]